MKTIAFYNNKGGVGKTTLAANIGYNLSTMGYRVLLVDCDPQGNLHHFLDDTPHKKGVDAGIGRTVTLHLSHNIQRTGYLAWQYL